MQSTESKEQRLKRVDMHDFFSQKINSAMEAIRRALVLEPCFMMMIILLLFQMNVMSNMGPGDVSGTEFSEIDVETGKYTEYAVFDLK